LALSQSYYISQFLFHYLLYAQSADFFILFTSSLHECAGNYHSGFGSEDAKSKWAPQAVVYGAPGANFMKASGSEWDSRQTKSFRMPRPRTDSDIDAPKSSTLTLEPKPVSSAPSSPAPATAASSSATSSLSLSTPAAGAAKPPRESLAQLASVGALKSVGERWGSPPPTGPAGDASRDQRRRAALEARKSETDSPISPRPAEKKEETPAAASPEVTITPAATPAPAPAATPAAAAAPAPAAAPVKTVDELKAELEQERAKFAADKAALDDHKAKFEEEKHAFEEQRKAFEEQKKAFEEEKKQWTEAHPQPQEETPAAAEVQA
jgi:hypothetical protein